MGAFKVPFDNDNYQHIIPSLDEYLKKDYVIGFDELCKGNVENCFWQKHIPTPQEIKSQEFKEREARRILKTGVFFSNYSEVIWLPPNIYYGLSYTRIPNGDPEFRLKRLMNAYFKIEARNNPLCKGTMVVKNRQDAETTQSMIDAFWESFSMEDGQITINSKTLADAKNPCWKTMQSIYMGMPRWLWEMFFGDCEHNGKNIAETIKFMRFADEERGVSAKNVLLAYYPAVFNSLDGKNSVRKAIGDEFLKWIEYNFGDWLNNASKFIVPGFQREGVFELYSSPPEKDSQSYRDGYELWLRSDTNKLQADGTTESRIHRWYSNPLWGIAKSYDKYGDADPQKIEAWIMTERKRQPKDKLLEEIRGYPLTEEEIWGSLEGGLFWKNTKGLAERQIFLLGTKYKDQETKEPTAVWGGLDWKNGIVDNPEGVVFRQSDKEEFDPIEAPFCFPYLPNRNLPPLKNIFRPPDYVEVVVGSDPFGKRHPNGKRSSNGALAILQFRDILETGRKWALLGQYFARPYHEDVYFENAIKACLYFQAPLQFESNHDRIGGYFTDRGYKAWCIPAIGERQGSDKLGDHVPSRGKFMSEMIALIDNWINIPVTTHGEPIPEECALNKLWIRHVVDDLLLFNDKDTHERDITMSIGQALLAAMKLSLQKPRTKSSYNDAVLSYLLS